MGGRFKAVRGGKGAVAVSLSQLEVDVLRRLLEELIDLLGDEDADAGAGAAGQDPLDALVGIGAATQRPQDPVLARLLPDGYTDDPEASAEFRRYTERGLRERKRASATAALATLRTGPGRRVLAPEQALAWLAALNDLRLAIGERLGLTEDWESDLADTAPGDPRQYALAVYDLLTYMQDSLVRALD